jgi:hypothetical protein
MGVLVMLLTTACGGSGDQTGALERNGYSLLVAPKLVNEAGTGFLNTRLSLVHGCVGLTFGGNNKTAVVMWPHGTRWISTKPLAIDVPGMGRVEEGDGLDGGGDHYSGRHPMSGVDVPTTCRNAPLVSFTPNQ